jgi:hypothetical protein
MKWPDRFVSNHVFPNSYPLTHFLDCRITVLHKLRTKPASNADHFILDVLILSEVHRRPAARCVEDIVVYDYKTAKKSALPPFMSERFMETWEAQEREKERCGKKVAGLERRVKMLEEGSWGREGAVEDLGSAV